MAQSVKDLLTKSGQQKAKVFNGAFQKDWTTERDVMVLDRKVL